MRPGVFRRRPVVDGQPAAAAPWGCTMGLRRGQHGLSDRLHGDAACEGAGQLLLARAGYYAPPRVDLRTLYDAARIEIDPTAPSGCTGLALRGGGRGRRRRRRDTVRLSLRGDPRRVFATLAHEGGHIAFGDYLDARAAGSPFRLELQAIGEDTRTHGEGDATRAALAFAWPRSVVRAVLDACGWDLGALGAVCPSLPLEWAILRAAWVADRGVVISAPGARAPLVWAPEDVVLPHWRAWAEDARRLTRRERAPLGVDRVEHVDALGRAWSVSVLPPAEAADAWRRLGARAAAP